MATVINNPGQSSENGNTGLIVGLVALILVILVLFYFGAPLFRSVRTGTSTPTIENNVQGGTPSNNDGGKGGTQINVPAVNIPDKVDVNVQGK